MAGQSLARRCSSFSTASRMKSERFSPSRHAASIRASVPAGNLPGVCSSLMRGLPTGERVGDITISVEACILLISPIASVRDITYVGDISYGGKAMPQFTAQFSSKDTIRLMQGDAIFAHVHYRKWDGREGWQYTRYGYTGVRTRKLRNTAVEVMMAAPRLSRADRKAAADAIAQITDDASVFDRILHLSEPEQAALAEIKRQLNPAVQHGASACHLPDHQYPQTLMLHGALDVSLLVAAIEQEITA